MVMQHSKQALNDLVDEWMDQAQTLWPATRSRPTDDDPQADYIEAHTLRVCSVMLRGLVKEML